MGLGFGGVGIGVWFEVHDLEFFFMGHGSWFMVHGSWFMVHGSWFMVQGSGFRVQSTSTSMQYYIHIPQRR